ncbi:hypothetical protein TWF718_005348 [Orbilia javanica]|uniref:Uncharacterized protein n=1 Tax=Orbilia javanica TaxID=47235 RepID=A0AAN8MUU4_9PEZI
MGITRFFNFRRRKNTGSTVPPEVAAEHARDENKRNYYSNIEENMRFEALVLNMMKEKERAVGGYGGTSVWADERPETNSSGVGSYRHEEDGSSHRSYTGYSSGTVGLSSAIYQTISGSHVTR